MTAFLKGVCGEQQAVLENIPYYMEQSVVMFTGQSCNTLFYFINSSKGWISHTEHNQVLPVTIRCVLMMFQIFIPFGICMVHLLG